MLQAAIPLVCCVLIWFCPESPRWLIQKGKIDKARRALLRVRDPHEVEPEIEEVCHANFFFLFIDIDILV